jgi:hypothetical protein
MGRVRPVTETSPGLRTIKSDARSDVNRRPFHIVCSIPTCALSNPGIPRISRGDLRHMRCRGDDVLGFAAPLLRQRLRRATQSPRLLVP